MPSTKFQNKSGKKNIKRKTNPIWNNIILTKMFMTHILMSKAGDSFN